MDEFDTVRVVVIVAIADPGLAGRFLGAAKPAVLSLFWAIIVSLSEGFDADMVLLDSPRPGFDGAPVFGGPLGL